jgi:hypothetical protein
MLSYLFGWRSAPSFSFLAAPCCVLIIASGAAAVPAVVRFAARNIADVRRAAANVRFLTIVKGIEYS